MRFKLTLHVQKKAFGNVLPINYQYEQSAAIYKILSKGNSEYATWLHENGYQLETKRFKMFTYSRFLIPQYRIDKENQRLIILSDTIEWYITFLPQKGTSHFIDGAFQSQTFEIGDKKSTVQFNVMQIEMCPPLDEKPEYLIETLSPICIGWQREDGKTEYLSPENPRFQNGLITGALNRYKAYYGKEYTGPVSCHFQLLNIPKPVLITFKAGDEFSSSKIKGYMCKFKIQIPYDLMNILWNSGFGEKGSLGFGMGKEREK